MTASAPCLQDLEKRVLQFARHLFARSGEPGDVSFYDEFMEHAQANLEAQELLLVLAQNPEICRNADAAREAGECGSLFVGLADALNDHLLALGTQEFNRLVKAGAERSRTPVELRYAGPTFAVSVSCPGRLNLKVRRLR
ncbi:hypothetical protein [Ramlibacter alkalitolerans]|uniref:Uncharacterized protein n=1 Tax=Ramlibacter alkalitolerans TaxID=2039631 RepID=A0ABS1JUA2_9BURK|nr:hypothetical protein [Ramlibacter alkalitolerans]MBL0427706.1 hypothetical protein [Ramlibacter alkalitolerans]